MPGPLDTTDDAALWRRWRSADAAAAIAAEPDPLLLAAYAEGRLSEQAAEAVEDWLALNPLAIQDILAARGVQNAPLPVAADTLIAPASALVGEHSAQVLAFRRPTASRRSWRTAASWSAMAASILVACFIGVAMGDATYVTLAGSPAGAVGQDLIDPPVGFFNGLDEDSDT
jgi:hypothetical protein